NLPERLPCFRKILREEDVVSGTPDLGTSSAGHAGRFDEDRDWGTRFAGSCGPSAGILCRRHVCRVEGDEELKPADAWDVVVPRHKSPQASSYSTQSCCIRSLGSSPSFCGPPFGLVSSLIWPVYSLPCVWR